MTPPTPLLHMRKNSMVSWFPCHYDDSMTTSQSQCGVTRPGLSPNFGRIHHPLRMANDQRRMCHHLERCDHHVWNLNIILWKNSWLDFPWFFSVCSNSILLSADGNIARSWQVGPNMITQRLFSHEKKTCSNMVNHHPLCSPFWWFDASKISAWARKDVPILGDGRTKTC